MALLEKIASGEVDTHYQTQAGLFKLPLEVRMSIYDCVFRENVLHFRMRIRPKHSIFAIWCIEHMDSRYGYTHMACNWFECPKKHMLGLPLTCRRLYAETIQHVYSKHTFHMQDDHFIRWADVTPKIHLDGITSLRFTYLDPHDEEEYTQVWDIISSLPKLKSLFVKIGSCGIADEWTEEMQQKVANPIKKVQQPTIEHFDLIFDIESTWFPDDCYLKISYNGLEWETFLFDMDQFPLFNGIHPRCRVAGINGSLHHHAVRDDMPTVAQLVEWINYFSCNSAYGYPDPEGYDEDEVGESASAAQDEHNNGCTYGNTWEEMQAEGQKEKARLEKEYIDSNDPEKWDVDALNRAVDLMNCQPPRWKWKFPEQPSWVKGRTLGSE